LNHPKLNPDWILFPIALCTADGSKIRRKLESVALCTAEYCGTGGFEQESGNQLYEIQQTLPMELLNVLGMWDRPLRQRVIWGRQCGTHSG
jgi:hypothetical protein